MVERAYPLTALAAASPVCADVRLSLLPSVRRTILHGDALKLDLPPPDLCRATLDGDRAVLRHRAQTNSCCWLPRSRISNCQPTPSMYRIAT